MYKPMSQKVKQPIKINLDKDRVYFWCTCGLSEKQPMCDGSHKEKTDKKSHSFRVDQTKEYFICSCKLTSNPPYCDGSHNK